MTIHNGRAMRFHVILTGVTVLAAAFLWARGHDARASEHAGLLVPTSGWLVGPASLLPQAIAGATQPCLMSNQYHNGYGLRLSGGDENLQAIALDLRQDIFEAGAYYPVVLQLKDGNGKTMAAQAHNANTIVINTSQLPDLYEKIKESESLRIEIGDEVINFALFGVADGFARLEQCYASAPKQNPAAQKPAPIPQAPARHAQFQMPPDKLPEPPAPEKLETPPAETPDAISAMLDRAVQSLRGRGEYTKAAEPARVTTNNPPEQTGEITGTMLAREWVGTVEAPQGAVATPDTVMRFRAVRGGDMHDILSRWSHSAGVTLDWRAAGNHTVPASISLQGRFEEAVSALQASFGPEGPDFQLQKDTAQAVRLIVQDKARDTDR